MGSSWSKPFKKIKKAVKNNFSWRSWKKGKGLIGWYNPAMKVRRDFLKIRNGLRKMKSGSSFTSSATPVNSARTISDLYGG